MKQAIIITLFFFLFLAMIPLASFTLLHIGICGVNQPCVIPVWFYPIVYAPSGVLFAGLALVLRDILQRLSNLSTSVFAIICGTLLSYIFIDRSLALAACSAYFVSELADTIVYSNLQRKNLVVAVLISASCGLVLDSLIFLQIAFHSYHYIAGQIIGKLLMVIIALPFIQLTRSKLVKT